MLTICYVTARKDNQVSWLFDSLDRELGGRYEDVELVVVDFWAEAQRPGEGWSREQASDRRASYRARKRGGDLRVVPPAPNVWQGPHRLTRENWYAKSNALNTAVMHARGQHLLFFDDLSVLRPGFMGVARGAMHHARRITAFAHDKYDRMMVEGGRIVSARPRQPRPFDDRVGASQGRPIRAPTGGWTYGQGLLVPLEAILSLNGWPQDCDGMRSQDSAFGIVAANAGFEIFFDPRAVVVESADRHDDGSVVMRGGSNAVHRGRKRKETFLGRCRSMRRFDNYYGPRGLGGARADVLAGRRVPRILSPTTDWFSGTPLSRYDPPRPNNELARRL